MSSVKLLTFYYEQCERNHFNASLTTMSLFSLKINCEEEINTIHLIAYSN